MSIKFHVNGKESDIVARQLAEHLKEKWGIVATISKQTPEGTTGEGHRVRGVVEGVLLAFHVLIVAHTAFETFVRQPREKAVAKWRELVFFAMEKRPTEIRAEIGDQITLLDKSDPEKLYQLARKALDSAIVTTE
jgi:hypothetical protein